jgi:hypothetical protein
MNKSKLWHALALVLFVAGLAVRDLQADPSLTSALHIGGAVLATAGLIVAMVSQALFGTPTPPNPNAASIAAQVATKVVGSMLAIGLALGVGGCSWLKGTAFPMVDKIETTVQNDLEAGDTDQQIASDVCADLGGTATTDAVCANVTTLVVDAIAILTDSGVLSHKAKTNGVAYLARHPKAAQ